MKIFTFWLDRDGSEQSQSARRKALVWGVLLAAMVSLAGCGGDGRKEHPETAIARGAVRYRGEPVREAVVVFQPSGPGGFAASAMTDVDGKFDMQAFPPESGAVPGSYVVMILKVSQEDIDQGGDRKAPKIQPKALVPAKYSDPNRSGLKIEVPAEGTENLIFDLKD